MVPSLTALLRNEPLRTFVGTVGIGTALIIFTEMTIEGMAPLAAIVFPMLAHDLLAEAYDLPPGTNVLVYGASVFVVGVFWVLRYPAPWVGGFLALVGLWFVFDGLTTHRYGPSSRAHEYVSGVDGEMGELLLRLQSVNVVYQALADSPEPHSVSEIAADVDLTNSRVESALEFLEREGRVDRMGDQYRAEPPRWGRLTPVVHFLVWLPRRLVRPFRRIVANS